ncbi:flagellar hook-associated protein FlgK [Hephaestia sp. GCM10023244]|uniref:flagellar hook-associated protein FlgK n=1 Tax=unclassified Hephaestia TaxID=2631281 RepID=UPI00207770E1|nr:flagellar hook-associated protein FlgK [Hephaestia sp. MAHUQ-44]MCM8731238.1 flagellar hook-associated protein FlgK [Hephaestia sp. MAHUQ-44]
MTDLLGIGASGVRAYQTAISTTSENIANAGTAGYVRRTTNMNEVAAASHGINGNAPLVASGVVVSGIARESDELRQSAVRTAGADLARSETAVTWLDQIEQALTRNGLSSALTGFFNATKAIAADPSASAPRLAMLDSASGLVDAFKGTASQLAQLGRDLDATAGNAVTTLNDLAAGLARVNDGLSRATPGSTGSAQLLDQRDQILEQMSALSDISVTMDVAGRATVKLGNANGPVFVAPGLEPGTVLYSRNTDGAVSFSMRRNGVSQSVSPAGGALAGIADSAQRLATATDAINRVVTEFVNGVNAVQAAGETLDGNAGAPMFTIGTDAASIAMTLTDPRGIAAATPGGGTRDNTNLAGFDALRSSGGAEGAVTALVADNGAALSSRRTVAAAQTSIHNGAIAARDQMSGVNLDSEAVDLMRYQQAYQASSRVIQVAREIFQSILNVS